MTEKAWTQVTFSSWNWTFLSENGPQKKCTQTWLVQCRFRKIQSLKKRGEKNPQTGKIIPIRKVMHFLSVKTYIIWWTVYRVKLSLLPNQQRTIVWIARSLHKKETFYNKSLWVEKEFKAALMKLRSNYVRSSLWYRECLPRAICAVLLKSWGRFIRIWEWSK